MKIGRMQIGLATAICNGFLISSARTVVNGCHRCGQCVLECRPRT